MRQLVQSRLKRVYNMVRKSYGKMRGTRHKMNLERKASIADHLREFNLGDKIHIDFTSHENLPHPKFQGLTGEVVGKRGRAYMVRIRDVNRFKVIFLKASHL